MELYMSRLLESLQLCTKAETIAGVDSWAQNVYDFANLLSSVSRGGNHLMLFCA